MREPTKAFAIWITGLPASGKSSLTAALARHLERKQVDAVVLESDALRKIFSTNPRYDDKEREYFYGSVAFIGKVLTDCGVSVIFDATANKRAYREPARKAIARFLEVYVDTPLDVCIQRDPKGIYRKALQGEGSNVPGLQASYEPPENPDFVFHGDKDHAEEAAGRIVEILQKRGHVG